MGYTHLHHLVSGNGVDSEFIFLANFSLLLGEVQGKKIVWEKVFSDQLLLKILNQSIQKGKRGSQGLLLDYEIKKLWMAIYLKCDSLLGKFCQPISIDLHIFTFNKCMIVSEDGRLHLLSFKI